MRFQRLEDSKAPGNASSRAPVPCPSSAHSLEPRLRSHVETNKGKRSAIMDARPIDRVWDIIEKVGVAMLTTRFAGGLRARPLEARPDRAAGLIWFLTDMRSGKDEEVATSPDVGLV